MWRRPLRETPGDGRRCRPSCARDLASSSEQLLAADLLTPPEKIMQCCYIYFNFVCTYICMYARSMYDVLYVEMYIFSSVLSPLS